MLGTGRLPKSCERLLYYSGKGGEGTTIPKASLALPVCSQPRATAAPAGPELEVLLCINQGSAKPKGAPLWLQTARLGPQSGRGAAQARGGGAGLRFRLSRRPPAAPAAPSRRPVSPSVRHSPPKPLLEDPGGEAQNSTYRRISCLVRNVRSWKAGRTEVSGPPRGRALPPLAPGPLPERRPARELPGRVPRTWYSASSSLDRRLPEPPIAELRAQCRQLVPGRWRLPHFRPRAASPPRPRGNCPWGGAAPGPPPPYSAQKFPAGFRRQVPALGGPWRAGGVAGAWPPTGPASGAGHAACVRARCACAEGAASSLRCGCSGWGSVRRASFSPRVSGGGGLG